MTGPDEFVPYLVSRYFSGLVGSVVSVLGPRYLVDIYFLHQRGRAFTFLHLALNFGASFGPTVSGFVAGGSYWPVEYWWSVALCAFTIIAVFLCLEETTYDRTPGAVNRIQPDSWLKNRYDTFFFGSKVGAGVSWGDMVRCSAFAQTPHLIFWLIPMQGIAFIQPLKMMFAPVILIIAGFDKIGRAHV